MLMFPQCSSSFFHIFWLLILFFDQNIPYSFIVTDIVVLLFWCYTLWHVIGQLLIIDPFFPMVLPKCIVSIFKTFIILHTISRTEFCCDINSEGMLIYWEIQFVIYTSYSNCHVLIRDKYTFFVWYATSNQCMIEKWEYVSSSSSI